MSERVERLTYSVPEAAALLGISRTVAYQAARSGDIPAVRIGRRLVVPRPALERMLAGVVESRPPLREVR